MLLVDTIGELKRLYSLADAAFVGGSLVPVGGHNVLEPAVLGAPVIFGPYTDHVREPAAELERAGGARRVRDARELGRAVLELVGDAERRAALIRGAQRVLSANRGALERSLDLVLAVLDRTAKVAVARSR